MRTRNLLPMAVIVLFLAGAALIVLVVVFRSSIPLRAAPGERQILSEGDAAEVATETPTEQTSEMPDCMEATLTVVEGNVMLRREGEADFVTATGSVWVGCGDTIRTGNSGIARITFLDDTETTLFPETELVIESFARNESGSFLIRLGQAIGLSFNRVNFPNANSTHEVVTPHGVAAVRGTAYWAEVHTGGDLDSFHCVSGTLTVTATRTSDSETIRCPTVTIDIGANGDVSTRDLDLYCGDGLCDPYMDEDETTCPQDCGD